MGGFENLMCERVLGKKNGLKFTGQYLELEREVILVRNCNTISVSLLIL